MTRRKQDVCGIYQIKCFANGKIYIGSSVAIQNRWYMHRFYLKKNEHHSSYMQRCWNKYGDRSFDFAILEKCDASILAEREQHYIDTLKPEFNGVVTIKPRTLNAEAEASRVAKIRAHHLARTKCYRGHEWTEENTIRDGSGRRLCKACRRRRLDNLNKKRNRESPQQREARLESKRKSYAKHRKGKARGDGPWITEETKAKISATLLAKMTHCVHGHEFTPENTRIEKCTGKRVCRECRRRVKLGVRLRETPEQRERRLEMRRQSERKIRERKHNTTHCL